MGRRSLTALDSKVVLRVARDVGMMEETPVAEPKIDGQSASWNIFARIQVFEELRRTSSTQRVLQSQGRRLFSGAAVGDEAGLGIVYQVGQRKKCQNRIERLVVRSGNQEKG